MTLQTTSISLCLGTLMLTVVGCAGAPLPTESPLAVAPVEFSSSEWRVTDHVFVVTDASGTMYSEKTFPRAKSLSRSFVAALPENAQRAKTPGRYNAGSIGFGGDDRVRLPLAAFDRVALAAAVSRVDIMGSIDGRGGMTPIRKIFGEIASELEGRSGNAAVVIFSDGVADDESAALAAAQALVVGHADGVCIHTVNAGRDPAGERFLRTLSELSSPCGSYRSVAGISDAAALTAFTRGVMAGSAPTETALPAVAANVCDGPVSLSGVNFAFDRSEILSDGRTILDLAAAQLLACDSVRIDVTGYTDSTGSEGYNQALSDRRADEVRIHLLRRGIDAARLTTSGRGKSEPIADNATAEGRAKNRRVRLTPTDN